MENIREKIDKRDEELEARFLLGMKGKRNIPIRIFSICVSYSRCM